MRLAALLLLLASPAAAQPINDRLAGDISPVHDPALIRDGAGGRWHLFSTGLPGGGGELLQWRTSPDLLTWTSAAPPVTQIPAWAKAMIPGATNLWAPDIAYVDGRYRLYYSVSTFGSNRSAIGLMTSPTLDRDAPGYGWRDKGLVVQSTPDDDFNAIDPNFLVDRDGRHWLSLGSFWGGIKLFELDRKTGKPLRPDAPHTLARRPAPAGAPAPVEAPFIIEHGGFYWLFASYDYCCKGVSSTYYTVVGRARHVTGPYLGKDGSSMLEGRGTIFLRADLPEKQRFRGPGHVGIARDADGREVVAYHAYDRQTRGAPTLRIAPIRWGADGWPTAED